MHHTQENIRQLPDSPGPGSPPPQNPSLLASYKEQSGPAEATSKELSLAPRGPPISSSLSGGKCKCAGVEMLQSQRRGWMEKAVLFVDQ